jgi:hypothetical protein
MTAMNVVRFRTKAGRETDFVESHRRLEPKLDGLRHARLVKTGENAFCLVGEWDDMDHLVAGRPEMIGMLDGFRDMLEDLGGGLGVTDPVSGEVVLELR